MEEEKNFHLMGKISPFRIAMVNNEFLAVREINNFILSFRLTLRMAKGGKKSSGINSNSCRRFIIIRQCFQQQSKSD